MNILITTSSLPINFNSVMNTGGAEKFAWDLAKLLAQKHKVSVIAFGKEHSFRQIDNVDVYFLKLVKHGLWYYLTFGKKSILNIFKIVKPDVVNSHMHNIITFVLRKQKVKKILTLHNSRFEFYNKSSIDTLKFNLFNKNSFKHYEISTVSNHMKEYLSKFLNKTVFHIPNGIDKSKFYLKEDLKRDPSILYVGRLEKFKGVDKIISLSKKLKSLKFKFIGSGSLYNCIKSDNVEFLGSKDRNELVKYYNSSMISIFPSEYENCPLVGLEAMACGSIVLANKIDGYREYIIDKKNGFLCDMSNQSEIIENINKILIDQNIHKIRKRALKKVSDLDINLIAEMYFNLYNK